MNRLHRTWKAAASLALAIVFTPADSARAQNVFGDWESGTREGWINWNFGGSPNTDVTPPLFEFNGIGATLGTGAIQYNSPGGYTQWLAIKLQNDAMDPLSNGIVDYRPGFLANTKLAFDLTFVASEQTAGNNYANLGLFLNSNTWGFNRIGTLSFGNYVPESVTPFTGYNGDHSWNPGALVGTQTATWVYDIGFLLDGNAENGEVVEGNYVEFIFEAYSDFAYVVHMDNVRFFTPFVATADFVDDNVIDGADLAVWRQHFGESGQTNATGDATGEGNVDGRDFLAWQREFGATEEGVLPAIGAVPEPHTAALLATVVGGWAAGRRRRFHGRSDL
jgi:hypothetical protein